MTTKGWGGNSNGHLGVGDTLAHSTPTTLAGAADFIQSAGAGPAGTAALFIATDQTVYYAGTNQHGQFGDGTASGGPPRTIPTLVPGLTNIVKTQAGDACYALDSGGTLWGWGGNQNGQLAQGATGPDRLTPIAINTGVTDFSSDGNSTIVLKAGGVVQSVGLNGFGDGRLGIGSATPQNVTSWTTTTPPSGTVVALAVGYACSLLRMADGTIMAAGSNSGGTTDPPGQLGLAPSNNPVWITLSYTGAVDLWAGYMTTFIRKSDGTIWGMGRNNQGQLGVGFSSGANLSGHERVPIQWVSPFPVGVTLRQVTREGLAWAFAVLGSDGLVYTWGAGDSGQMGNGGTTFANPTPASTNGLINQKWVAAGALSMWSGDAVLARRASSWVAVIG